MADRALPKWGFLGGSVVKNPPASAGDIGDTSSIPGWERSPGEGKGNPLQYSGLGNPMDRGASRTTVLGVAGVGDDGGTEHSAMRAPPKWSVLTPPTED